MKANVTQIQARILAFIVEYQGARGYSPSFVEIGEAVGIVKSGVSKHLKDLADRGVLHRRKGSRRNIEIVRESLVSERSEVEVITGMVIAAIGHDRWTRMSHEEQTQNLLEMRRAYNFVTSRVIPKATLSRLSRP